MKVFQHDDNHIMIKDDKGMVLCTIDADEFNINYSINPKGVKDIIRDPGMFIVISTKRGK